MVNYLKDRKSRFFLTALPTLSLPNYGFLINVYQKQPLRDELVFLTQNKPGRCYRYLRGHTSQLKGRRRGRAALAIPPQLLAQIIVFIQFGLFKQKRRFPPPSLAPPHPPVTVPRHGRLERVTATVRPLRSCGTGRSEGPRGWGGHGTGPAAAGATRVAFTRNSALDPPLPWAGLKAAGTGGGTRRGCSAGTGTCRSPDAPLRHRGPVTAAQAGTAVCRFIGIPHPTVSARRATAPGSDPAGGCPGSRSCP